MYRVIEAHIDLILNELNHTKDSHTEENHVKNYDWLVENCAMVDTREYQNRYMWFWSMNRMPREWREQYFCRLKKGYLHPPNLTELARELYQKPTAHNRSLQFSFCSKLCHMLDRHLPIYDSMICAFFFFKPPSPQKDVEKRIDSLKAFHSFLSREYTRIIDQNLLEKALTAFKNRFDSKNFTDEKIIDTLIWQYTKLAAKKVVAGSIIYD